MVYLHINNSATESDKMLLIWNRDSTTSNFKYIIFNVPKIVERKLVSNVVLGYLFTKVLSSDVYFTELPVKIDGLQKLKVSKLTDYVNILLLDSKSRNNLSSNFGGTTRQLSPHLRLKKEPENSTKEFEINLANWKNRFAIKVTIKSTLIPFIASSREVCVSFEIHLSPHWRSESARKRVEVRKIPG